MKINYKNFLFTSLFLMTAQASASQAVLSYETFQRLSAPQNQEGATNWFTLNFVTEKAKKRFDTYMDLAVRFYHGKDSYHYSLPEAYVSLNREDEHLFFGRHIVDWTPAEKFWALGQLNAVQGFTLLGQEQEGVTGAHYDVRFDHFKFSMIASYLYVPSTSPIKMKDGKVTSNLEWVKLPPKRTVVNNQVVPLYYELQMPQTGEVVFKKTLGTNLTYLWDKGSVSAFGIYKPENKLRLNAEAFYDPAREQVTVKASPFVNHHLLYGVQAAHRTGNTIFNTGVQMNDPTLELGSDLGVLKDKHGVAKRNNFESKYFSIRPKYEKEAYAYFSTTFDREYYNLSVNAIELLTNNQRVGDDLYSETVKWHRALGLGLDYDITESFKTNFSFQYDVVMADALLRNEFAYSFFGRDMSLAMGYEMISSVKTQSYWASYRANDTVYSTLSYTF